jgi:hypothetical protein
MSIRGGVEKPKLFATLTRSSLCTSNTERREWLAYAWRYDLYPSLADLFRSVQSQYIVLVEREKYALTIVLRNKSLELRLDVEDLVGGQLKLNKRHTSLLQKREETNLRRKKEHQTSALGRGSSCSTDSVNVVTGVIRGLGES